MDIPENWINILKVHKPKRFFFHCKLKRFFFHVYLTLTFYSFPFNLLISVYLFLLFLVYMSLKLPCNLSLLQYAY